MTKMTDSTYELSASILNADFGRLAEEIVAVEKAGADAIHIDVMDGHFVPNLTIGLPIVEAARAASRKTIDVHLMIDNPHLYIDHFAEAGADRITVHVEAMVHADRILQSIAEHKVEVGVALNPATSLYVLDHLYDKIDMVLLMSVNPGFAGQKLVPEVVHKVNVLHKKMERAGHSIPIQVDGGINVETIGDMAKAGARSFVAASAIFGQQDYAAAISALRSRIEQAGGRY